MEPRKSFKTQTGIEFNDGTQKHVVGNVKDLASKPLDKDKNKKVSTTVFNMIPEGEVLALLEGFKPSIEAF